MKRLLPRRKARPLIDHRAEALAAESSATWRRILWYVIVSLLPLALYWLATLIGYQPSESSTGQGQYLGAVSDSEYVGPSNEIERGSTPSLVKRTTWPDELASFVAFVEETRGLQFQHPVPVRFESEAATAQHQGISLSSPFYQSVKQQSDWEHVEDILGLTTTWMPTDVVGVGGASSSDGAFFDVQQEVVVLPVDPNHDLSVSIVHAMTHLLQAQNGLLDGVSAGQDAHLMWMLLLESDAQRVADLWVARDGRTRSTVGDAGSLELVDAVVNQVGPLLIDSLRPTSGVATLDEWMLRPDVSTEALIDPATKSPWPTSAVDRLPADTSGGGAQYGLLERVGPLRLYLSLVSDVGAEVALQALSGYDTDSFQFWQTSGHGCMDLRIWFGRLEEAEEFVSLATPAWDDLVVALAGYPSKPAVDVVLCDDRPAKTSNLGVSDLVAPLLDQLER